MWRYFTIATVIVIALVAIVASLPHARRLDPQSRYSSGSGTPGPGQRDDARQAALPVTGEAPWALSALPECFRQLAVARGPVAFVRQHIPIGAKLVPRGTRLASGDCRVWLHGGGAQVDRRENHFRIPAPVRLYTTERFLLLESDDGVTGIVRTYGLPHAGAGG